MRITDRRNSISALFTLSAAGVDLTHTEQGGTARFYASSSHHKNPDDDDDEDRSWDTASTYIKIEESTTLIPTLTITAPAHTTLTISWLLDGHPFQTTTLTTTPKTPTISATLPEVTTTDYYSRQRLSKITAMLADTASLPHFFRDPETLADVRSSSRVFLDDAYASAGSLRADIYVSRPGAWVRAHEVRPPAASEFRDAHSAATLLSDCSDVKLGLLDAGPAEEGLDVAPDPSEGARHWVSLEFLLRSNDWLKRNKIGLSASVWCEYRDPQERAVRPLKNRGMELRVPGEPAPPARSARASQAISLADLSLDPSLASTPPAKRRRSHCSPGTCLSTSNTAIKDKDDGGGHSEGEGEGECIVLARRRSPAKLIRTQAGLEAEADARRKVKQLISKIYKRRDAAAAATGRKWKRGERERLMGGKGVDESVWSKDEDEDEV